MGEAGMRTDVFVLHPTIAFIGRVMFTLIFFLSGITHFTDLKQYVALMPSAIPFRTFWVMASEGAIAVPDLVTYVPVDFEKESLADELARAGFDAREPAFFSWLGVTPYLRLGSVMATLRYVAAATRTGGGVVFDYAIAPRLLPPRRRAAFDALARRVSAAGEPWQTFFEPSSLVQDLRAMGFGRVVDFGPEELNARYFAGRADCLRLGGSARLMSASP